LGPGPEEEEKWGDVDVNIAEGPSAIELLIYKLSINE
jgi:hypothetical protein